MMDSVTLENFRCFRERQTARLAPLTLLVGENSTGKTSFLAMLRILSELRDGSTSADFKEPPYDLGSFDEIAHNRGRRGGRADEFTIGFERDDKPRRRKGASDQLRALYTFRKHTSAPELFRRTLCVGDVVVDEECDADGSYHARLRSATGAWTLDASGSQYGRLSLGQYRWFLDQPRRHPRFANDPAVPPEVKATGGSPEWTDEYADAFLRIPYGMAYFFREGPSAFAGAPVRSKPHRTYDPARPDPDPEGDYIPMYLSNLSFQHEQHWLQLKDHLAEFGQIAGLFDELSIRQLGRGGSDPFQIQVRKGDGRRKGQWRNFADVGYGVSQVLPVVTELLRPDTPGQILLQQPEVHLHPSAQAALGTLFCQVAATGRQLIVETHSDYVIDRVRMDVRDGTTKLNPEDVSLLYFERTGLDVRIHPLRFDQQGNVLGAPSGYRQFFLKEVNRSLGL